MNEHQLKRLIGGAITVTAILLFVGCAATQTGYVADVDTDVERALLASGFRVRSAVTADQRNQVVSLPANRFTEVQHSGNTYYLYPDKRENRLFAGDHWAYMAYRGYVHNRKLREKGAFVWEVDPSNKPNNKTVEIWHGWTPFPEWSPSRPNVSEPTGP